MAVSVAEFKTEDVKRLLLAFNKNLHKISTKSKSFSDLLSVIVFKDVIDHFENETGSKGKWKPWSVTYRERMAKIGKSGNKILQDSGRLRNSFQPGNYRTTSASIIWFNPAKTFKGFPYAFAHDTGGPKLPKRDFMWLSDKAAKKFEKQALKFLQGE